MRRMHHVIIQVSVQGEGTDCGCVPLWREHLLSLQRLQRVRMCSSLSSACAARRALAALL